MKNPTPWALRMGMALFLTSLLAMALLPACKHEPPVAPAGATTDDNGGGDDDDGDDD